MIKFQVLLFSMLFAVSSYGQITIIGHNKLNNDPLKNTIILVKEGATVTRTLNTKTSSDFLLKLDFGKKYSVYFQNPKSPVTYLEVDATKVPEDKYSYKMLHEIDIPFYNKEDDDIDTIVFEDPFNRIVFDGKSKMVSDSVYNNAFSKKVLKVLSEDEKTMTRAISQEAPVMIAGQIILNNNFRLTVNNKVIVLLNKKGDVIGTTTTNRFGAFSFSKVKASEVAKLRMKLKEVTASNSVFTLVNSKNYTVTAAKFENGYCNWELGRDDVNGIIDNHYTISIGGKLVSSSPAQKKVFAGQTVYLCNKFNTVIKKTNTTLLGTFVFEGLKPDQGYFVGVDQKEVKSGEKLDLLNKDDKFIASLDTFAGGKVLLRLESSYNNAFSEISISNAEMTMNVKATIYGDNLNNPIGKLKVILLNDSYQVIDSAITDDFGSFKFIYLPFLKRFYLSAENSDNILDVYNNILIYNTDYNLVKIMTHEKGSKFTYKPLSAEIFRLRDVELEDPWLDFIGSKKNGAANKIIIENIMFGNNSYEIGPQAREILDKVILVLETNKKLKIEIGAHTDSQGTAESNLKLSELRATTVLNYIKNSGINPGRIISKGYGETKLMNNCDDTRPCDEIEHAKNRRIEFKILED
ncbi:MAG TPA: OmpA family protein [Bacteroidia bacterium]|nr:OmpA family protein [Bacteroidia bacterium]